MQQELLRSIWFSLAAAERRLLAWRKR